MKKIIFLSLIAGMFFLASCGPSEAEIAAEKKRVDDSIAEAQSALAAIEQARLDSIALADSLELVRVNDSIALAEAAKKTGGKPKAPKAPETKVPDTKTPTTGVDGRKKEPVEAPKTGKEGRK